MGGGGGGGEAETSEDSLGNIYLACSRRSDSRAGAVSEFFSRALLSWNRLIFIGKKEPSTGIAVLRSRGQEGQEGSREGSIKSAGTGLCLKVGR